MGKTSDEEGTTIEKERELKTIKQKILLNCSDFLYGPIPTSQIKSHLDGSDLKFMYNQNMESIKK